MKRFILAGVAVSLSLLLVGCCCNNYSPASTYTGPAYTYFPSHYYYTNTGCNQCCNGC